MKARQKQTGAVVREENGEFVVTEETIVLDRSNDKVGDTIAIGQDDGVVYVIKTSILKQFIENSD